MDKNSALYFMTQMTQEEFEGLVKDKIIKKARFNKIQPERSKREDNQFCTASILNAYNG